MNQPQQPPRVPQRQPLPDRIPEWRRRATLPADDPERGKGKDMTSVVISR